MRPGVAALRTQERPDAAVPWAMGFEEEYGNDYYPERQSASAVQTGGQSSSR